MTAAVQLHERKSTYCSGSATLAQMLSGYLNSHGDIVRALGIGLVPSSHNAAQIKRKRIQTICISNAVRSTSSMYLGCQVDLGVGNEIRTYLVINLCNLTDDEYLLPMSVTSLVIMNEPMIGNKAAWTLWLPRK